MDRKISGKTQIVKIRNRFLLETRTDVRFFNLDKEQTFVGALFWEPDAEDEVVEILDELVLSDVNIDEYLIRSYRLMKKWGRVASDDMTLKTMMHWQFVNGFSDYYLDGYYYKSDSDYFARKGVMA